jgi:hypothetical protein
VNVKNYINKNRRALEKRHRNKRKHAKSVTNDLGQHKSSGWGEEKIENSCT